MRVFLMGHRPQIRLALRGLLAQDPELDVVGEIGDTKDVLIRVHETRPDIVMLDWELPGFKAVDLLLGLQALRRPPKVVALSEREDARQEALAAGADAFVRRDETPEWVVNTVRSVGRLSPYMVS